LIGHSRLPDSTRRRPALQHRPLDTSAGACVPASRKGFDFQHTWPPTRIGATVDVHFAISQSTCQLSVGKEVDWTGDEWPNGVGVVIRGARHDIAHERRRRCAHAESGDALSQTIDSPTTPTRADPTRDADLRSAPQRKRHCGQPLRQTLPSVAVPFPLSVRGAALDFVRKTGYYFLHDRKKKVTTSC
jgi:hypothetical protein